MYYSFSTIDRIVHSQGKQIKIRVEKKILQSNPSYIAIITSYKFT